MSIALADEQEVEISAAGIDVAQQPAVEVARISGAGHLVTLAPAVYDAGRRRRGEDLLSQRGVSPSSAVVVLLSLSGIMCV